MSTSLVTRAHDAEEPDSGASQTMTPASNPPSNEMENPQNCSEEFQLSQAWTDHQVSSPRRTAGFPAMTIQTFQHGQHGTFGTFDMTPLNDALHIIARQQQQQQSLHYVDGPHQTYVPASPTRAHPIQHMPPFPGPSVQMASSPYYMQQAPVPQSYLPAQMHQAPQQPLLQGHQNLVYFPNQMIVNHGQPNYFFPHDGQFPGHIPSVSAKMLTGPLTPGVHAAGPRNQYQGTSRQVRVQRRHSELPPPKQSIVRGPPQKPRQSGHALWIGNLPPQADLMALVQHICQTAPGLESLFLISKSNCAFANYKDEGTCLDAQQNLHDSRFQSVRLVSRLRKSAVEESRGQVTSPIPVAAVNTPTTLPETFDNMTEDVSESGTADADQSSLYFPSLGCDNQPRLRPDKFFILKSLTIEDLDMSVRNGVWATQAHNEENLNRAFHTADNVYLIFSANKSGEYFGYARMISKINDDPAAAIEFAPRALVTDEIELPKAILTDATEFVPRGKIIDDLARGTIFWEAERDEDDAISDVGSDNVSEKSLREEGDAKLWGKPFKLVWLSTLRLPFYRTRGLRNPWNSNREVKIARDGTELEPSVGRKLIGLFNRLQTSPTTGSSMRGPMNLMPSYAPGQPLG